MYFSVYAARFDGDLNPQKNIDIEELKFFSQDEIQKMMKTYKELVNKPEAFEALFKYLDQI